MSVARMSTSWQYGDVSPARYPFQEEEEEEEEDKKAPVKRKRKENQEVAHEAAEPPVKIYKEARQKAAEKRKEKKKEQETKLNEAACELDGLLASVPSLNELPSYQEMVVMEQLPSLEHESPTEGRGFAVASPMCLESTLVHHR